MKNLSLPSSHNFNHSTLEDFIIFNISYLICEFKNYTINRTTNQWYTLIETSIKPYRLSTESMKRICFYIDVVYEYEFLIKPPYSIKSPSSSKSIVDIINLVKQSLKKSSPQRSRIVSKVFNFDTALIEYELENGDYVAINGDEMIYPERNIDSNIFNIELLKIFDLQEYRNSKIEEII